MPPSTISVLVPTYRRPESLKACLVGLEKQTRPADEICVITHAGDSTSAEALRAFSEASNLRVLVTEEMGQVRQLNVGLEESVGDIVAITDDDAVPKPDWLERIAKIFLDEPSLGGVGGRDFVHEPGSTFLESRSVVGTVRWFGRVTGGHHVGIRKQMNIDILKGVNMAFRRAAIGDARFDTHLRGKGAQTCNDMAFSLDIRRHGWRLAFDPEIAVDHYPATRADVTRGVMDAQALENDSYNFYRALLRHMQPGIRRMLALCWARAVGVRNSPGWIRHLLSTVRGDSSSTEARRCANRAWAAARRTGSL